MSKQLTGILGGTFDPIHNGHLFLALEALHVHQLDRVLFVPNRVPPHKAAPGVDAEARWQMLVQAISNEPRFVASRIELEREGPSYTLHTVEALSSDNKLVFICGADAFFSPWHRPDRVLEQLHALVIAHRYGVPKELPPQLRDLSPRLQKKIHHLDFPDIAISSTDLRRRISSGRPFRYLVPETVYDYIQSEQLYLKSL